MNRWPLTWAWALGLAWLLAGCGGDDHHDMSLLTIAEWKENPGTVEEIGYWITVDLDWPDRSHSCFDLPAGLHVNVNGREGIKWHDSDGDCEREVTYDVGPFLPDERQTANVRVLDGDKVLGEATYPDLFPGTVARLASPADGKARMGDSVIVNLLSPYHGYATTPGSYDFAAYYWLDSPDGVPPYRSSKRAYMSEDQRSMTIETPDRTGRAVLEIGVYDFAVTTSAEACEGFTTCEGWPSRTVSPVFVEVVP